MKAIIEKCGDDVIVTIDDTRTGYIGRRVSVYQMKDGGYYVRVYDTWFDRWKRCGVLADVRDHTIAVDEVEDRR